MLWLPGKREIVPSLITPVATLASFRSIALALLITALSFTTINAQQPGRQITTGQSPTLRQAPVQQPPGQLIANQPSAGQQQSQQLQQPANNQFRVVDPATAVAQGAARVAEPPFPQLSQEEQHRLDQILQVWEQSTAKINTFECKFKRWVYNPNSHETHPESIAEGSIRYKSPDMGSFKEDARVALAGTKPDGSPDYKVNPRLPHGDWWVCDGEWVHQLDRNAKKAIQTQLPPELRGTNIPLSPLPFMFGVKAHEVKARYFIREIPAQPGNSDVWVEAWPKRSDDAGNYSRVQIVLDRSDNLPKAMILFMPNWSPQARHRELYEFSSRQVNSLLDKIKQNLFMQSFIDTKVGSDWQVIREGWIPPEQAPVVTNDPANSDRLATPGIPAASR
ncbi:MAG: TIGR03009 domain-containing protein [Pirellulaceae bacterium]|nr:TIGR03009 domain-containing protein [Pirellulaceae bacterium]